MKKNFFAAALALSTATLASALLSAPAKAQTATVPITVEVPDIIYLETYTDLNFTPTIGDLSTGTPGSPIQTEAGTVSDFTTPVVNNALNGGGAITFNSNKTLTGLIVYKVWGIGGPNGNIAHEAAYSGALTKGASTIDLTVTPAGVQSTPAPGLDYANAIEGTLDFDFDFTGVTESGSHAGGTLTITATAE
ncbi:hypothetical protein IQ259_16525 [Fortiea sp. LEGE XX443]|uniref:hypothetical protein n=1 Tax=Fortiea sp. LEGE XX443 TaxID=1828611 RepID=UPI00187F2D8F|nr:hypothetical protein [Fortiea sp. LEGE XX443]MBE9006626.1 hypothetical protein [Fortiea sp. LEGE XX443]